MLKRLLTFLLILFLASTGVAQAKTYPDTLDLFRADSMKIRLLRKTDGPDGDAYYIYSEPGETVWCTDMWNDQEMPSGKPQSMEDLAVSLGKQNSKNISATNRTHIMWDDSNNAYRVQLPTAGELEQLRAKHKGMPSSWGQVCGLGGTPFLQGGPEFWTSDRNWNDHSTYRLDNGQVTYRWDSNAWAVALKVRKVDQDEVCLFEHEQYVGSLWCLTAGDHPWLYGMNDKTTSIIAGKNCSARLYEHGIFDGRSMIYNERRKSAEPWYFLNSMNDRASSLKVRCGEDSVVGDSEVCLFEHGDLTGNVACYGNGDVRHIENYPDGARAEDTFSSMVVGKNCSVTLYQNDFYAGANASYSAKSTGKNLKVNWLGDMNDKTSSLKVSCN